MAYIPDPVRIADPADSLKDGMERINANLDAIAMAFAQTSGMAGFDYSKRLLTGGGDALDGIDGADLTGDETALVIVGDNPAAVYVYVLDADSGQDENLPYVIAPDENAGTKRWVLGARVPRMWTGSGAPTITDDVATGVRPGDLWRYAGDVWVCADDAASAAIWVKALKLGTASGTACAGNDARLSNARTPTAHAGTHLSGQGDAITGIENLPGSGEKAALAGTSGTPGSGNKYVTDADARNTNARTPTAHAGSHLSGQGDAITGIENLPEAGEKAALAGTSGTPGSGNKYVTDTDARNANARTPTAHGSSAHSGTIGTESQITFDQAAGHAHTGTGSHAVDHVNLANKGTNAHSVIDTHLGASAPHSGHEATANKGAANGYAGLGANSLVPTTQLGGGTPDATTFLRGDQIYQTPSASGGASDVVGGRLEKVSATSLKWAFIFSNHILIYTGTAWELVKVATEPTAANTANDLDSAALAVDYNYDVFGEYINATSFGLCFKKWTNNTTRAVTPSLFEGIYVYDTSAAGKKRRFLGTIRMLNSSGAKFEDSNAYRYISNYYNRVPKLMLITNSTSSWTYNVASWREFNAGTGQQRGSFVTCIVQQCELQAHWEAWMDSSMQFYGLSVAYDGTGITEATIYPVNGTREVRTLIVNKEVTNVGYHYFTFLELGEAALNLTNYGTQPYCVGLFHLMM